MTKLVIFDCDGVLVDSEGPTNEVLSANLGRYGLPVSPQECEALFVGGTIAGVGQQALRMGASLPTGWVDEIYVEIYARLAQGIEIIPGIPEVLDHLDTTGLPYCVGSNGSVEKMRITLGQTGLWNRFEGRIFSAHSLGVAKPDPDLFLAAARHFQADPADCVVIEDSVTGATAAQRAGMRCLAYVVDHDRARFQALGAEILCEMQDLPSRL